MHKAKPGISKEVGYIKGVFSATYDLQGIVRAFGPKLVHALVDLVATEGEISPNDLKHDVSDYIFASTILDNLEDIQPTKPKRDARGRFVKA